MSRSRDNTKSLEKIGAKCQFEAEIKVTSVDNATICSSIAFFHWLCKREGKRGAAVP